MTKNQTEEYTLPIFFIFYRSIAPSYSEVVFHHPSRSITLTNSHSYINEFYLANGIKESLKEHGFDKLAIE
jgi:hypothetical protein